MEFLWHASGSVGVLDAQAIHIWAVSLNASPAQVWALCTLLSPDEQLRASRFRREIHRNRYVAGRAALRQLLGQYLHAEPRSIAFCYGAHGKPSLWSKGSDPPLHFNLAHSEDIALLAVSRKGSLGIDVEALRAMPDRDKLVKQFFSIREVRLFQELPEAERVEAFFKLWTRKEALLKATGDGIGSPLKLVEVTFLPEDRPAFLNLPTAVGPAVQWTLIHLIPASGFIGALACPFAAPDLQCRAWHPVSEPKNSANIVR